MSLVLLKSNFFVKCIHNGTQSLKKKLNIRRFPADQEKKPCINIYENAT